MSEQKVTAENCNSVSFESLEKAAKSILDNHPYGKRYTKDETTIVHTWYHLRVANNKAKRQEAKQLRMMEVEERRQKREDAKLEAAEANAESLQKRLEKLEAEAAKIRAKLAGEDEDADADEVEIDPHTYAETDPAGDPA